MSCYIFSFPNEKAQRVVQRAWPGVRAFTDVCACQLPRPADAGQRSFQHYSSGIYYEPNCHTLLLNHAVLAVGYGSTDDGDYYIVKNSWGTSWGDSGYVLMARNRDNNCGIASDVNLPIA